MNNNNKKKHFSLVSMLMEVPVGHQWRRDKLPEGRQYSKLNVNIIMLQTE
jgi:hypothetical protein